LFANHWRFFPSGKSRSRTYKFFVLLNVT
jgi:hypothetical protein